MHAAFPDVETAPNGDILVVFRLGRSHVYGRDGRILLSRSRDKGKSWQTKEIIHTPERFVRYEGSYELVSDDRDPSLATLSNGEILLNWFHWGDGDRDSPTSSIYISKSRDSGESWSKPKMIFFNAATSDAVLEIERGVLLLPAYGSLGDEFSSSFLLRSEDYGETWHEKVIIIARGRDFGFDFYEPAITKLREGELLCVLRTSVGFLYESRSRDGGKTWEKPNPLPFYGHCPDLLTLTDSRVILTFRDIELYEKEKWFWEKLLYNLGLRDIAPISPLPYTRTLPEAVAMVEALPPEYSFTKEGKIIVYEPRGYKTESGDLLLGDAGYPSAIEIDEGRVMIVFYEAPYGYGGRYAPWSEIMGAIIKL